MRWIPTSCLVTVVVGVAFADDTAAHDSGDTATPDTGARDSGDTATRDSADTGLDSGDTASHDTADTGPADTGEDDDGVAACLQTLGLAWLPDAVAVIEGSKVNLPLDTCVGSYHLEVQEFLAEGAFDCRAVDADIECEGHDQGNGIVGVVITHQGEIIAARWMQLTVVNVPPLLVAPQPGIATPPSYVGGGCGGFGEPFDNEESWATTQHSADHQFEASDPADRLSWSIENGPPGLEVGQDGQVFWTPDADDIGDWNLTLVVRDDVSEDRQDYTLHVVSTPLGVYDPRYVMFGCMGYYAALRKRAWPTGRTTDRQLS